MPPAEQLEETTEMCMYNVADEYSAEPEIQEPLPERTDWYGSELSSTVGIDVYIWHYKLLAVQYACLLHAKYFTCCLIRKGVENWSIMVNCRLFVIYPTIYHNRQVFDIFYELNNT